MRKSITQSILPKEKANNQNGNMEKSFIIKCIWYMSFKRIWKTWDRKKKCLTSFELELLYSRSENCDMMQFWTSPVIEIQEKSLYKPGHAKPWKHITSIQPNIHESKKNNTHQFTSFSLFINPLQESGDEDRFDDNDIWLDVLFCFGLIL